MADSRITIPNDWRPRRHQLQSWRLMDGSGHRAKDPAALRENENSGANEVRLGCVEWRNQS
jgi:hypothetical protein